MSLSSDGTVMTMPVQPANTGNGNGWGFGGDGAWWIIILFLFVFCGWGGNWGNNGFGGGNGAGAVDGYILTSDFANIERKIDVVNNGLCDGFYAQAQLVNGVQNAMQQGFMSAEISRANMRGNYGRGSSYARRGSHYVRGHYSMDDGRDSLISRMEDIMRGADSKDREVIQRCIDTMRNG